MVDKPSRPGVERGRLPNFKHCSLLKEVCPTVGMEGTPVGCGDYLQKHLGVKIDFEAFTADRCSRSGSVRQPLACHFGGGGETANTFLTLEF